MFKQNKGKLLLTSIITLLPILIGLVLWDTLPDKMPTHWGVNGEVDGWQSKPFAIFFLPIFLLVIHLFTLLITSMDMQNKEQNMAMLNFVFWICPVMSLVMSFSIYGTALGYHIDMNMYLSLLLGLVFIFLGKILPKCEPNNVMGIRVSTTLQSEENWRRTHEFGGKVWMLGGVLMMLTAFLPPVVNFVALILIVVVVTVIPISYSHKLSKNE